MLVIYCSYFFTTTAYTTLGRKHAAFFIFYIIFEVLLKHIGIITALKTVNEITTIPPCGCVSYNVIRVTLPWPRSERVGLHQFEMFTILKYVVIQWRILGPVAKQPAEAWQAVSTTIAVGELKCYFTSMKWIWLPSTDLRHFTCQCDLAFAQFTSKMGHVTGNSCWIYLSISKLIDLLFFLNVHS